MGQYPEHLHEVIAVDLNEDIYDETLDDLGKDENYWIWISEIKNGVSYNPVSALEDSIRKLSEKSGVSIDEIRADIGIEF